MQIGIIRNPRSGRGAKEGGWPKILDRIRAAASSSEILCEHTSAPGSATEQARRLSATCAVVVAAGGDGTVHDVAEGLLGTSAALGVLPLGTGNDFARTLGFGTDLDSAIEALAAGHRRRIDIGRWTQGDRSGMFINVAGCGFDAVVAHRVNVGYRFLRGTTAYLVGVLQTLITFRPVMMRLEIDGELVQARTMLCALANATCYGGGMRIAPLADMADGYLDLVLVGELGRMEFVRNFPKVMRGAHLSHPKVLHRRFRELTVRCEPEAPCLVDGELLGKGPLHVRVDPLALDVIVPK